jgi:hypothetical protein
MAMSVLATMEQRMTRKRKGLLKKEQRETLSR